MELSPEQAQKIKDAVEQALGGLQAKANDLAQQPGQTKEKKEIARKIGVLTGALAGFKIGALPSAEEAADLLEDLEKNVEWLRKLIRAVFGAIKDIIQGIFELLRELRDGIVSLFPKEEKKATLKAENAMFRDGLIRFSLSADASDPPGILTLPEGFGGAPAARTLAYMPRYLDLAIRLATPGENRGAGVIESFVGVSQPVELGGMRFPFFVQSLDTRLPSTCTIDWATGEVDGVLHSRLADGMVYTARAPIVVRTTITGRARVEAGLLELDLSSVDIASDAPFRAGGSGGLFLGNAVGLAGGGAFQAVTWNMPAGNMPTGNAPIANMPVGNVPTN
jgi:hypothetical protein